MKIQVGQIFRVPFRTEQDSLEIDLIHLTRGAHKTGIDLQKGIFFYREVKDPYGQSRRPAFILTSNNLQAASPFNPWLDIIEPENGYALYHGDNKTPGQDPMQARGNHALSQSLPLYSDPVKREQAPPILLFEQVDAAGRQKGFRRFAGYGVPRYVRIQSQTGGTGTFANLVIELVLMGLEAESEQFDWTWIDKRRDPALTAKETLQYAPKAWKEWVARGESALDSVRRRVLKQRIVSIAEQRNMPSHHAELLQHIHRHYQNTPHAFEALASLVVSSILGPKCERGWVTRRSGDGGIDFVSRLDMGSGFSSTSAVILGQAKCVSPDAAVAGRDLARVVARLKRGWVGAFVTTGTFSRAVQAEILEDAYPLVMVNGKRLATEISMELSSSGFTLEQLLAREEAWYNQNLRPLEPDRILRDIHAGTAMGSWGLQGE